MLSERNYHHYFFVLFIFLFLYYQNIHLLSFSKVFFSLVVSLLFAFTLYFLATKLTGDKHKSAILTSIFVLLFFNYGRLFDSFIRPPAINSLFWKVLLFVMPTASIALFYYLHLRKKELPAIKIHLLILVITFAFFLLLKKTIFSSRSLHFIRAIHVAMTQQYAFFSLFFIVFVAILFLVLRSKKNLESVNYFFHVLSAVLVVMVLVQIALYAISAPATNYAPDESVKASFRPELVTGNISLPDIYYLILDGYAGRETLRRVFHYDNSDFIAALESRGFYVAENSRSNYMTTYLSLASSLNMAYLDFLQENPGADSVDPTIPYQLLEYNQVVKSLKMLGYKSIHFSSWWGPTEDNKLADVVYDNFKVNEFSLVFLRSTPLRILAPNDAYLTVKYAFDKLPEVPLMEGPKIVFAHIINPHPPFVFDSQGNEKSNVAYDPRGAQWADKPAYVEQVIFVNTMTLNVIDEIKKKSKAEPIIIIQADHGTESVFGWTKNPNRERLDERSRILNAYFLPDGGHEMLYDTISPVNSFRLIFNYYFNQSYEAFDDLTYFSDYYLSPYDFHLVFNNGNYVGSFPDFALNNVPDKSLNINHSVFNQSFYS